MTKEILPVKNLTGWKTTMTTEVTLSDKIAAVGVAVILCGLAVGINHFQKLGGELTSKIPATPTRELTKIQQTCVPSTPVYNLKGTRRSADTHSPKAG